MPSANTGSGPKPKWPTPAQIDRLRDLGAAPSHFVLEAGDFVHINKARLHAFRTPAGNITPARQTHENNCEKELRLSKRVAENPRERERNAILF